MLVVGMVEKWRGLLCSMLSFKVYVFFVEVLIGVEK